MRKVKKTVDEQLNSLLDITYAISKVYDGLVKSTLENNSRKYQEQINSLLSCQELENKIYQELNVTLKNYDSITDRVEKMNHERNEELERKNRVIARINNHLLKRHYLNPFLSMEKDLKLCNQENMIAILNQYDRDYTLMILYLFDLKIKEEQDLGLKEEFIHFKYEVLMMFKPYENDYFFHQGCNHKPMIDGRNRSLLFGQDEWELLNFYSKKTMTMLEFNIYQIINLSEEDIRASKSTQAFYQKQLISLESILALLGKEEQEVVCQEFVYTYLPTLQELGAEKKIQDICRVFNKSESFVKKKVKSMETFD